MSKFAETTAMLAYLPDITSDMANCIQTNGVRITGPLSDWQGPPPTHDCELYVRKIPHILCELDILPHFKRFGPIYEFRLMMDYNAQNRGFAFVKYTTEAHALRAMEVLAHLFILPGKRLEIEKSYDKCRLFVGNIPKTLPSDQVHHNFRIIFPDMIRLVLHRDTANPRQNRGFAFVDFADHHTANRAKLELTASNSHCQIWNRPLKIVWANPERSVDHHAFSQTKTLFVRNVNMAINKEMILRHLSTAVERRRIEKIARTRECAFIDFRDRESGQRVIDQLNGSTLKGSQLDIQWALPPHSDSLHHMRHMDFDKDLRLKCMANRWTMPVYLFGRLFGNVQYVAVMLRTEIGEIRAFFLEMAVDSPDIHSRVAEVIVTLIKVFGCLPLHNYILKVANDSFSIVGEIQLTNGIIHKVTGLIHCTQVYCNELIQLSASIHALSLISHDGLRYIFKETINSLNVFPIVSKLFAGTRVFGCMRSDYRKHEPLRYGLHEDHIIFVSCDQTSGNNFEYTGQPYTYCDFKYNAVDHPISRDIRYRVFHLLPLPFIGGNRRDKFASYICFGYRLHAANGLNHDDDATALLNMLIDSLVMPMNKLGVSSDTSSGVCSI